MWAYLHKICNYKSKSVCKSKIGILLRTGTDRYEPSRLFKITNLILWKSLIVSETGILGFTNRKNDKKFSITLNFHKILHGLVFDVWRWRKTYDSDFMTLTTGNISKVTSVFTPPWNDRKNWHLDDIWCLSRKIGTKN